MLLIVIVIAVLLVAGAIWFFMVRMTNHAPIGEVNLPTATTSTTLTACDTNIIQTYSTDPNPADFIAPTSSDNTTTTYLEAIDPYFSAGDRYNAYATRNGQIYYADLSLPNGSGYNKTFTINFWRISLDDLIHGNTAGVQSLGQAPWEPNQLIMFLGITGNTLIYEADWYEYAPDGSENTSSINSALYAINASSGAPLWHLSPSPIDQEQIVNGVLYGISASGNLTAIDPTSGQTIWNVSNVVRFVASNTILYATMGGNTTSTGFTTIAAQSGAVLNKVTLDYPGTVIGWCNGSLYVDTDEFPDQSNYSIYRMNSNLSDLTQIFNGPVPPSMK
jgi:outer membrane protein assembly factor BamB